MNRAGHGKTDDCQKGWDGEVPWLGRRGKSGWVRHRSPSWGHPKIRFQLLDRCPGEPGEVVPADEVPGAWGDGTPNQGMVQEPSHLLFLWRWEMPLSICESINKLGGTGILQMGIWMKLTCKYYPVELRAGTGAAISGGPSVSWPWPSQEEWTCQKQKQKQT